MRRCSGSLVGPVLMIGIGSLFLAQNLFPELRWLDFDRMWPAVLILFGIAGLLRRLGTRWI